MSDEPRPKVRSRTMRPAGVGMDRGRRLSPLHPERGPRIPTLDYRLVVLTNGRPCVRETLEAFRALATPQPREVLIVDDGGNFFSPYGGGTEWHAIPVLTTRLQPARGFCAATAAAWQLAAVPELTVAGPLEWVFWLEDDFVLNRPLDVRELAAVMEAEPQLAQMALYRNPVSDREHYDGGYLQDPDRDYAPRETDGHAWFEHHHYWTTNPSLFRRELAEHHSWPGALGQTECEGLFGFYLLRHRPATTYGVWGAGERWVEHVGVREGFGY